MYKNPTEDIIFKYHIQLQIYIWREKNWEKEIYMKELAQKIHGACKSEICSEGQQRLREETMLQLILKAEFLFLQGTSVFFLLKSSNRLDEDHSHSKWCSTLLKVYWFKGLITLLKIPLEKKKSALDSNILSAFDPNLGVVPIKVGT